jgi:hypothetical protein
MYSPKRRKEAAKEISMNGANRLLKKHLSSRSIFKVKAVSTLDLSREIDGFH